MCGRYATTRNATDLAAIFEAADETDAALTPDYNVAPTDPVPVVRMSRRLGSRALSVARWGLIPFPRSATVSGKGRNMINARVETVVTSRAYGPSFARRRCLIPADGWYEWVRGARRQPYFMTSGDGSPVVFAGLWAASAEATGQRLTCTIVTSAAIGELAGVHDRMPLLLPPDRWAAWLDGPADDPSLLVPTPESVVASLEIRPVGAAVGDVRNDGPALIERVSVADDPVPLF